MPIADGEIPSTIYQIEIMANGLQTHAMREEEEQMRSTHGGEQRDVQDETRI